jgi:UDP-N-acetylglucosamine transferase subunit ALG13
MIHFRYTGAAPEPRPSLSSGHIPNSFSLPFNTFLQKHTSKVDGSEYTTFLPQDALMRVLETAVGHEQAQSIIEQKKLVVTTCGSGMTAGVLWLGLRLLGVKNIALYDEVHESANYPIRTKLINIITVLDRLCNASVQQDHQKLSLLQTYFCVIEEYHGVSDQSFNRII